MSPPGAPPGDGVELADERYTLRARLEIVSLLRAVADQRAPVTLYFLGGSGFVVSSLLHVNPEFEELVFDVGADAEANARLLRATRITLVTWLDGVKMQFTAQRAESTLYDGLAALRMRVPAELLRLQRREFFRAKTPVVNAIHAVVPLAPGHEPLALRILDISAGGVALAAPENAPRLEVEKVYANCRIALPEFGEMRTGLEIRSHVVVAEPGAKVHRYGCRFQGLPQAAAQGVTRYIMKLERQARSGGR